MELRDYIEEGAAKAGSLTALARMLNMSQPNLSHCKGMRHPLPLKAAVQLAEYIGADLKAVIAANELVTEKDEEKRAFWSPFVQDARAASIALALALVTNFVTTSTAEAAPLRNSAVQRLCIMLIRGFIRHLKKRQLFRAIRPFIESYQKGPVASFPARLLQV